VDSLFDLGNLYITPAARDQLDGPSVQAALERHATGDWGELDSQDNLANDRALCLGGRLFSAYNDGDKTRFWIITEADRSCTTILLPADY